MLPIVQRELLVAARNNATYRERLWFPLGILLTGGWLYYTMSQGSPPPFVGRTLFLILSGYLFLLAGTAGLKETSDALSSEKRNGTLGLLFLTDLKGWDVVLGKLVSLGYRNILNIVGSFPLMAIPLLLGGIEATHVLLTCVFVVNTLFISLSIGLFCSAILNDERRSASLSILILLLLCLYPFIISLVLYRINGVWPSTPPAAQMTPWYAMQRLTGKLNIFIGWDLTLSWALGQAVGWSFLAAAAFFIPRTWQEKGTIREGSWKFWKKNPGANGSFESRGADLDRNPFLWLATYFPNGVAMIWCVIAIALVVWLVGYFKFNPMWRSLPVYIVLILIFHGVLKFWTASQSGIQVCRDRISGALELILSTPLSETEVVKGLHLSLFRLLRGPLITILCLDVVMILDAAINPNQPMSGEDLKAWILTGCAGIVVLLADLYTLAWVGIWTGLKAPRTNQAAGMAVGRVLMLPWGLFYILVSSYLLISRKLGFQSSDLEFLGSLLIWTAISIVLDLFLISSSKKTILQQMRTKAAEKTAPGPEAFWITLGRLFGKLVKLVRGR